jgi:DNA repair photolyase
MGDFEIIKKTTGEASDYAPFVVELYQKRNGKTEQIEDALNRLSKDAALLKGNQNSHKILLCSETDPYPPDYECNTITRGAIEILDNNELKYVILT